MGSDESHFNVSLIVGTKSQDSVHRPQLLKRKESRSGVEPRSLCLPASRLTARPKRRIVHFALRPQKRDGLLVTETGEKGTKQLRLDRGYRQKKTGETVDRRQNNGSVKAVSPRHCPATSALCNCCFNCRAGQSQGQCPLHFC